MAFELIMNGINLGLGVLGTAASIGSFVSGFSLDKDINRIKKSVSRLDDIAIHIKSMNDIENRASGLLKGIHDNIPVFGCDNFTQQQMVVRELNQQYLNMQNQISHERKLIIEAMHEMKEVVKSVTFSQGERIPTSEHFVQSILNNPFMAGMHVAKPFDISNLSAMNITQRVVNRNISPVLWNNGFGQTIYGIISNTTLNKNGIHVQLPSYATVEGHIFSERHGLYLPSLIT